MMGVWLDAVLAKLPSDCLCLRGHNASTSTVKPRKGEGVGGAGYHVCISTPILVYLCVCRNLPDTLTRMTTFCTCIHVRVCTSARMYVWKCLCVCVCVCLSARACINTHPQIGTRAYTHYSIPTHAHTWHQKQRGREK